MVLPRPTALSARGLRLLLLAPGARGPAPPTRAFGSSQALLKKRRIAAPGPARGETGETGSGGGGGDDDALDVSALAAAFEPADAHFRAQLQALLHGGRFDPSSLGALPVAVKAEAGGGDGGGGGVFPLRELAQVVPRSGRAISLLVNDAAYIKPIMSAVQGSPDFNQQPQRAPDNPLELLLRVELDRPEHLARRVRDAVQAWRDRIRRDRARRDRLLKDRLRAAAVLPDAARMAERDMQKLQDRKMRDIDAEEARALKQLARK